MQVSKKVVAAISTALGAYLQEEQEALMAQQRRVADVPPHASAWALTGRSNMMDMRRMWQLRLAH